MTDVILKIEKNLSNSIQNTSISGVKFSWTTLYFKSIPFSSHTALKKGAMPSRSAYSFSIGKTNMPVPMPEVARPNSTVARPSAQCLATMITAVSEHSPRPTPADSAKLQVGRLETYF